MPSFDIVSEVDFQELKNAVDQANREIGNRYDFKGTDARVEHADTLVTVFADNEFQVEQAMDILQNKMAKRKIDLKCLDLKEVQASSGGTARQEAVIRHGIDKDKARQLVKSIKISKLKVQAAIQGEQIRVSGKKRDELQAVIEHVRAEEKSLPLQFTNFRD